MAAHVIPVVDHGLGNTAWLVDLGDGRALAVDATRDLRALLGAAGSHGLRVAYAADTHLHADFVTAAVDLAADGAQLLASAAGLREYGHRGLADDDDVDLGGLSLRALATPGHTDEHLAFLLLDGADPIGVFTGGSLIVGSAARTDLVDPDRTVELARAQWRSLRRLATLPDDVPVWPTHGAGSFCAAPPGAARASTIGREKSGNELLKAGNEEEFVHRLLAGLGDYPAYFRDLAEVNRRGPGPLRRVPTLAALTPHQVAAAVADGATVIDVRPVEAFAAGHVPGAVSIPLRDAFATWLGWTRRIDEALVFVRNADQDPGEILWQALKVGFERHVGELAGDMASWAAARMPVRTTMLVGVGDVGGRPDRAVVDVRQRGEFRAGHVPGATNVQLGDLAEGRASAPDTPSVVMCGHGERAMTAASLLERAGRSDVAVLTGGPHEWAAHSGSLLEATT